MLKQKAYYRFSSFPPNGQFQLHRALRCNAFVEILLSHPLLIMNKNIMSGYSGVKLLRETYTLESPRDPCKGQLDPGPIHTFKQVNTPFTRDIIRGRVHIRAHWSHVRVRGRSTILCRHLSFYTSPPPPPASSSSVSLTPAFSDFRSRLYVSIRWYVIYVPGLEEFRGGRQETRAYVLRVRERRLVPLKTDHAA